MRKSTAAALADPECILWRVVMPYACFGILVRDGVIVEGSGIARWAEGKRLDELAAWLKAKRPGSRLEAMPLPDHMRMVRAAFGCKSPR